MRTSEFLPISALCLLGSAASAAFVAPGHLHGRGPARARKPACVAELAPGVDILDAVLAAPLLLPVLGYLVVQSAGAAASSALTAKQAQADLEAAQKEAQSTIKALDAALADKEAALVRKGKFWDERATQVRKEKDAVVEQLRQLKASAKAAPPPTPPPPSPASAKPAWRQKLRVVDRSGMGQLTRLKAGLYPGDLVVVAGAETLTGRLVVEELVRRVPGVRVRACGEEVAALEAALTAEPEGGSAAVERVAFNQSATDPAAAYDALVAGAAAVVWCRSSPRNADGSFLEQLFTPVAAGGGTSGAGEAAEALRRASALLQSDAIGPITPKFVLLSTAGASRVAWGAQRKRELAAAAEVPAVRLNPQDLLGAKLRDEAALRAAGLPHAIVRPCDVDGEARAGGGVVLSSGDVATGRIARPDVAALLVAALFEPAAAGKTFEAFSVPGLPARPLAPALEALPADSADGGPPPEASTYALLRQLAP